VCVCVCVLKDHDHPIHTWTRLIVVSHLLCYFVFWSLCLALVLRSSS